MNAIIIQQMIAWLKFFYNLSFLAKSWQNPASIYMRAMSVLAEFCHDLAENDEL